MADPSFAEARARCAQTPVTIDEMIEVIDRIERRITGEKERAMFGEANSALYREPVVLEAVLNHLRRGGKHLPEREYGR